MKECPSCKAKNQNDAAFCAECGTSLKDVPTQTDEWAAAAGDFLNKAKGAAAIGARKAKEAAQAGAEKAQQAAQAGAEKAQQAMEKAAEARANSASQGSASVSGHSILVDPTEQIVATIGSSYLQNYLSGGGFGKGIGILTPKRFYYKGKNFAGKGKQMVSTTEEGIVSIEDITFTMFSHTRYIGALIFAILLTAAAVFLFTIPYNVSRSDVPYFLAMFLLAAAVIGYITYFLNRQTLFQVSFPGGSFGFDIRYYPIADFQDFQRQLHLLKDHRKETV